MGLDGAGVVVAAGMVSAAQDGISAGVVVDSSLPCFANIGKTRPFSSRGCDFTVSTDAADLFAAAFASHTLLSFRLSSPRVSRSRFRRPN